MPPLDGWRPNLLIPADNFVDSESGQGCFYCASENWAVWIAGGLFPQ
jgi:hypothetical protein